MADTTRSRRVSVPEGTRFRDWVVDGHIADGGQASVYRARFVGAFARPNQPVVAALKVTVPLAAEERDALIREYRTAISFPDHPTVVTVYDAFEDATEAGRCVVLVHELGDSSLADRIPLTPLDADESRALAADIAAALASFHAAGVVHSDVKPENVLRVGNRWKLSDLGAAALVRADTTTAAPFIGTTLLYSPPEHSVDIVDGRTPEVTHPDADVWAFGVMLHEAATGHRPFADSVAWIKGDADIEPTLPDDLRRVIAASLQKDRAQRLRDGRAIVEMLPVAAPVAPEPALARPITAPLPPPPAGQPASAPSSAAGAYSTPRRGRGGLAVLLVGVVALLTFSAIALTHKSSTSSSSTSSSSTSGFPPPTSMPATTTVASVGATTSPTSAQGAGSSAVVFGSTAGWSSADCKLPIATSTEKAALMAEAVAQFNAAAAKAKSCVVATAYPITSGDASTYLVAGWPRDRTGAPNPVIWSPAASSWGALTAHLTQTSLLPTSIPVSLMQSPLVIALPQSVASRLGARQGSFGFGALRDAALADPGFAIVRTYPRSSTAALNGLVAQYYAAGGPASTASQRAAFNSDLESADTRYRDNTLDALDDLFTGKFARLDAMVVEEKSVNDYNRGDPRGLSPGATKSVPADPLVAFLPSEGTVVSDHPLYVLTADWVTARQRCAADRFIAFATSKAFQEQVGTWGFRPSGGAIAAAAPALTAPDGATLAALQSEWQASRKPLRLELVVDLSGSMAREDRLTRVRSALAEIIKDQGCGCLPPACQARMASWKIGCRSVGSAIRSPRSPGRSMRFVSYRMATRLCIVR
jgi:serine/threonine protein kinase